MVYRVRKKLVEEGFAPVLTHKPHTRPSALEQSSAIYLTGIKTNSWILRSKNVS